jgi:hypothetical protein
VHAQAAKQFGDIAYGVNSEEAKVFSQICSLWETSKDQDLLDVVQEAIANLRDIDKK